MVVGFGNVSGLRFCDGRPVQPRAGGREPCTPECTQSTFPMSLIRETADNSAKHPDRLLTVRVMPMSITLAKCYFGPLTRSDCQDGLALPLYGISLARVRPPDQPAVKDYEYQSDKNDKR